MGKVLLINSPFLWSDNYDPESSKYLSQLSRIPIGLAYLSAALKDDCHSVFVMDLWKHQLDLNTLSMRIREIKPDLVGINVCSPTIIASVNIAKSIKKTFPEITLIAGGPHPSGWPESLCRCNSPFDVIIVGPGEKPICTVAKSPNAFLRISKHSLPKILFGNLDNTNISRMADLSIFDLNDYSDREPEIPLVTSRGCEFKCTYCAIAKLDQKVYRKSVGNVVNTINFCMEQYGIKHFKIVSENIIGSNHYHFERLMHSFKEMNSFSFNCQARYDKLKKGDGKLLANAGCKKICFGIDAVSSKAQKVARRPLNQDLAISKVRELTDEGINCQAVFVIGFPGESAIDFEETARLAHLLKYHGASEIVFYPLMMFPGTEIWEKYGRTNLFGSTPVSSKAIEYAPKPLKGHLNKYPLVPDKTLCCNGSTGKLMLELASCYNLVMNEEWNFKNKNYFEGFINLIDLEGSYLPTVLL